MGIYASVMALGFVLGPLIVNLTGIEGWTPFAAVSAALVVALMPVAFARQVAPIVTGHGTGGVGRAFAAAPTVMLAALVAGFVDAGLFTQITVYELGAGFDRKIATGSLSIFMSVQCLNATSVMEASGFRAAISSCSRSSSLRGGRMAHGS